MSTRLAEAVTEADPVTRLRLLAVIHQETCEMSDALRIAKRDTIRELRATGMTWQRIGDALGVSKQRAEQLAR